jgi:hypothetical protein
MQNADQYQLFEGRTEGDAQLLGHALDDLTSLQEHQQADSRAGEPVSSNPGVSGPAEGLDVDPLSREMTPSESGEGTFEDDVFICS